MDKAKDVASKVNSSSKQVKHKSAKNKGASSLKNVSSQNANNASGRIGVAAVALASTLSMLLPGATALAKTPLNADSFDSSYVKSAAKTSGKGAGKGNGKGDGKGDGNDLYKNGLLNTGATSERAMRQMVGSAKEYLVKHADSNADSNNSAAGVDNQEAAAGDSSVSVKDSGERSDAGSETGNDAGSEAATDSATETATKGEQDNQKVAKSDSKASKKEQPAEVKPAETPASKTEPTKSEPAEAEPANSESAAKTDSETKTNSSAKTEADQKSAKPANTENAKPENAQNTQPASTENTQPENVQNAQPVAKSGKEKTEPATENTDSENINPAAEQPAAEQSTSTESAQPTAKAKNDSTTSRVRNRRSVENNGGDNSGSSVTPADNAPETPSASAPSAGTESSAGVGATENTDSKEPSAKEQGTEGNANGAVADRSGEGANGSNSDSNANSQVIKPNEQNQTAGSTSEANGQVQTDKKPRATYNLQIRYTIGGAANKQLVQPYELTIDVEKLNTLGKDGKYEYIELPKAAGYRPSVYHSGDYQYYVKKGKGDNSKFVIDDGTNADAVRYLRLNKKLITDYAIKKRQAVGGSNSDQTSQNPSPSQQGSDDGIQYYGELNINYAPKTAKYYVRHLVQDLKNKDEFHDAPNLGIGKVITVKHKDGSTERIHVTEITGTVGSDVSAVSTYIPGYEPEHNLISSPLSDSDSESDKLILNLRYYRKTYDVTYDTDGGTDITAQKVYYQQLVQPVKNPTKRGYTFKGWSVVDPSKKNNPLYDDNTIVSLDDYKMPDHNVQFLANWEANKTTSYRVNVWVQKADLVDKKNPDSLANYDFVGLVERNNVKTDSDVALDKMNDAGVVADGTKLNGTDKDNPISDSELGLTEEELQGTDSDHKTGLIAKFNWMNDTPVTSLEGYDTTNPGDAKNKGKDLFTRYFKVNKKLTNKLNESKKTLKANDLKNTIDLVYDRNEYELIFANPANIDKSDYNPRIRRKDSKGDYVTYCYAGSAGCSTELNKKDYETYKLDGKEINSKIDHKGYRVKVRYGQKLNDVWPSVYELSFEKDEDGNKRGSLGFLIGYAGDYKYRDTPPYRFTKEEFADPSLRAAFKKDQKDKVEPRISDNPLDPNAKQYELKDNQRLLVADSSLQNHVIPVHVAIEKQSIASAKNCDKNIKYELSADSYSKDDTNSPDYMASAPSIAGFETVEKKVKPQYSYEEDDVADDNDGFFEKLYQESDYYKEKNRKEWSDLEDDEQKEFRKRYNLAFRSNIGTADAEVDDDAYFDKNFYAEFKYNRKSYAVQFYNADGNAINDGSDAAKEKLPFEYSLTKRGKKDLTGEDADLYYNKGAVKSYDDSVTKDGGDNTATQFDGKYTFTLNGKTYSIERPKNLPEDYVFKGWALDQAGTQFINGENKDITMPVNGIKLYAAWGEPEGIQHTVTFDYNMPQTDESGKEIKHSDVVTEKKFDHYQVIDEKKITTPTRKGYDFYGWELAKKGNEVVPANTPYAFGNKVVEDITLKAVWIEDTRYNGNFKHVFLKPGYTFADYKQAGLSESAKAAMVDHVSTQTVSGLREHLRYNAEAVYSDETHFPDKHFTSFEASKYEEQNTGEFIYQTYNTRKYKVRYVTIGEDGQEKDLLPESEVSSVNRKYDVAFYKPIAGFMPRTTKQRIEYFTNKDGKQTREDTFKFVYDDVRVLKRKDDTQVRPTNYTRYVFKVAAGQSNMGSIVGYDSRPAGEGGLVYDVIGGTKAYQMPLPQEPVAKAGYEFAGWTSEIYIDDGNGGQTVTGGFDRLPILSESQSNPKVVYTANFKLKAPVAIDTKVLKPTDALTLDEASAKDLIKNADEYPEGATFSFADGATFDNTPGLHKIKVQVKLDGHTAQTEVLYRVLPDLVYESDWEKFKATGYGSTHKDDYVPIKFTGSNDKGKLIGHDSDNADTPGGTTTLTAYAYKGKEVRIRVPQAFGKDYSYQHYHYVFKGWTTGTETDPAKITKYDIKSEDRYKADTFDNDVTYHAVYKKIEYFSSSSDGGEVPKDAVVAIFKPAPGRLWTDGTSGPKVFYVKKGTNLADITVKVKVKGSDGTTKEKEEKALDFLQSNLTNPTGKWSRSSMLNDGKKVAEVKDVATVTKDWKDGWKVNEPFQEFVADQKAWTEPDVKKDYFVAVQGDASTLPNLKDYVINLKALCDEAKIDANNVADVKVEYDLPQEEQEKFKQKMLDKPATYTVPLKITVNYKDGVEPKPYKSVGLLKVIHKLMYPESLPKLANGEIDINSPEAQQVLNNNNFAKVNFINAYKDQYSRDGKGSFGKNDRTLYYALKNSATGVKAPQVTGKDYDANGYHYVFKGWRKLDYFVDPAANSTVHMRARRSLPDYSSIPLTTLFVNQPTSATSVNVSDTKKDLLTDEQIRNEMHYADTTYQAEYDKIPNVIDASTTKKTLEGYVPAVFLPEIGHRWKNGEYKPKLLYIRPSKEKTDNVKFMKKVADDTGKELYGFSKWRMFTAQGDKLDAATNDSWNISAPLMFVAEQTGVSDITIPETIVSAGDAIPDLDQLVNNTDPTNVKVEINHIYGQGVKPKDSKETDDRKRVYSPGTATVVVDVTRKIDGTNPDGSQKTITTQIPIRVRVLPNVIADQDLPANDTKESKYIAQNYTKVTYVAGSGGEMKSSVFTYWVRKGTKDLHMPVPDVLADKGYVFKDWSTVRTDYSLDLSMNNAATSDQKEFLAKRAELAGLSFIAKKIRASERSSFATLKNLLDLGGKENGITISLEETTITANFEQMDPVEFKFSGKAVEGVPATFTLANLTRGVLNADGTTDTNATVSVDNKQFIVNALSSSSLRQLGISSSCSGATCTISGTPKIVDGKKVVELTFTSIDKYGRKAKVTVDIEVLPASNDVNPTPTPTPEPDYSTVPSDYVVPAYEPAPVPAPVPVVPLQDKQKTGVKGDLLPQTGVDASQSALIASLLASVGFAGFAAKHRRKREDGKNN